MSTHKAHYVVGATRWGNVSEILRRKKTACGMRAADAKLFTGERKKVTCAKCKAVNK